MVNKGSKLSQTNNLEDNKQPTELDDHYSHKYKYKYNNKTKEENNFVNNNKYKYKRDKNKNYSDEGRKSFHGRCTDLYGCIFHIAQSKFNKTLKDIYNYAGKNYIPCVYKSLKLGRGMSYHYINQSIEISPNLKQLEWMRLCSNNESRATSRRKKTTKKIGLRCSHHLWTMD